MQNFRHEIVFERVENTFKRVVEKEKNKRVIYLSEDEEESPYFYVPTGFFAWLNEKNRITGKEINRGVKTLRAYEEMLDSERNLAHLLCFKYNTKFSIVYTDEFDKKRLPYLIESADVFDPKEKYKIKSNKTTPLLQDTSNTRTS